MKPISFVTAAGMVLAFLCLLPAPAEAWLSYSVPAIEGTVTDATTGIPIQNAVLVVKWNKTVYGPWEPRIDVIKKMYVATDDKGVFRIPAHGSAHIFSSFADVNWVIRHPLYETDQLGISRSTLDALKHPETVPEKKRAEIAQYMSVAPSGEIVKNISLLSLKEKYKESPMVGGFRGSLGNELGLEGPIYFLVAKKLELLINADAVFNEWEEIASRFKDVEYIHKALETGKKRAFAGDVDDY